VKKSIWIHRASVSSWGWRLEALGGYEGTEIFIRRHNLKSVHSGTAAMKQEKARAEKRTLLEKLAGVNNRLGHPL